jgi:uncharacterized protein YmfQ (DUF2313 family)
MSFYELLKNLLPRGPYDPDDTSASNRSLYVKAARLDGVSLALNALLLEMRPETASDSIHDWEVMCGLVPGQDDTLQTRRQRIIAKLNETGGLSIPYFIELAAALGYEIEIEELTPFMANIGRAGDRIYVDDVLKMWRVKVLDSGAKVMYFRAGESESGEKLTDWPNDDYLEALFKRLKPAGSFVFFEYT